MVREWLYVDREILLIYPRLSLLVIRVSGVNNKGDCSVFGDEVERVIGEARRNYSLEGLASHPRVRVWREIYRAMGAKKLRPSHEALVRRVLRRGELPCLNPLATAYLLGVVKFLVPCGGYDLAKVRGRIVLRKSPGGESFTPIGGGVEYTVPGEVVYADEEGVLTRFWNYRDSARTAFTEETRDALLIVEDPYSGYVDVLQEFARYFSQLASRLGGVTEWAVWRAGENA